MDGAGILALKLDPTREDLQRALDRQLKAIPASGAVGFERSLEVAAACRQLGQSDSAYGWLRQAALEAETFLQWQAAALTFRDMRREVAPRARRKARVAVLGSYTTSQLVPLLGLAAFREEVDVEIYESRYGQYSQDLSDPESEVHAFPPEAGTLAAHTYGGQARVALRDDPDAQLSHDARGPRRGRVRRLREAGFVVREARLVRRPLLVPDQAGGRPGRPAAARLSHRRGACGDAWLEQEMPGPRPRRHPVGRNHRRGWAEWDHPGRRPGRRGLRRLPVVPPRSEEEGNPPGGRLQE